MPRPKPDPNKAGFTLIEIAVVLVILALSYGLVLPAFSNFIAGSRLDSAAREVAMALREARSTAIVTGRALSFDIDAAGWRFGDRQGAFDDALTVRVDGGGITFFADGASTGGRILLDSAERRRMIEIHWLTGRVTQSQS